MAAADLLRFDDVVAGYGKETILHGLSFAVPRGAITTVIGPNGAGKSTAFKAAFGMLPVRSGRVFFDERDITNRAPRELIAEGMCYVPQGRNIFPELSVLHNLEFGGVAAPQGAPPGLHALGRRAEDPRDRARLDAAAPADADRRTFHRACFATAPGSPRGSCRARRG